MSQLTSIPSIKNATPAYDIAEDAEETFVFENDKVPGGAYSEKITARFWISGQKGGYLGVGRIELLEKIGESGSISQAAKSMGMSYKKAWKLVEELNHMYSEPLVAKVQGGKSGGGSELTQRGLEVIQNFRAFEKRFARFLQQESELITI